MFFSAHDIFLCDFVLLDHVNFSEDSPYFVSNNSLIWYSHHKLLSNRVLKTGAGSAYILFYFILFNFFCLLFGTTPSGVTQGLLLVLAQRSSSGLTPALCSKIILCGANLSQQCARQVLTPSSSLVDIQAFYLE